MEKKLIPKGQLVHLVDKAKKHMGVFGPVKQEDYVVFRPLQEGENPLPSFGNARNAPKEFLFPPREVMMIYSQRGRDMVYGGEYIQENRALLFFVRPCDARSFVLLDMLFDQETYRDPYYVRRRAATIVITLACNKAPYKACFCTAVGGSPVSADGADIFLTDIGDAYLAEFITEKGRGLLEIWDELPAADDEAVKKKENIAKEAIDSLESKPPADKIKVFLDRNFEHPFWDTIHQRCLKCGTCTYLCPTCHCFDINDETKKTNGVRLRNWDSCMYPTFTQMASGHNPRPTQKERWRQRVMHKFKYYVDNFGAISCVGCGRCVILCPVNIDIRKIITEIAQL